MTVVCPTITAKTKVDFKAQVDLISDFANRVHLDIADGFFAPKLFAADKIWLPKCTVDIHVMYECPGQIIETLINLKPHLIIIHYESDIDFNYVSEALRANNIKFGVAILQQTDTDVLEQFKNIIDHVLIFSGNLGYFGGNADLGLAQKAIDIKKLNPKIEIGWDGGINLSNAKILSDHHVDVLNVGGYIHRAKDPMKAYDEMVESIGATK